MLFTPFPSPLWIFQKIAVNLGVFPSSHVESGRIHKWDRGSWPKAQILRRNTCQNCCNKVLWLDKYCMIWQKTNLYRSSVSPNVYFKFLKFLSFAFVTYRSKFRIWVLFFSPFWKPFWWLVNVLQYYLIFKLFQTSSLSWLHYLIQWPPPKKKNPVFTSFIYWLWQWIYLGGFFCRK